jgi:hypothetical protein
VNCCFFLFAPVQPCSLSIFFYVITDIDEQKRFVKTYLSASVTWEFTVLEPNKKAHLTPCISPKFYSWTGRGGRASNMVLEPRGLEFEPRTCIFY